MNAMVATYVLYLAISIGLTVWVARTLYRNGGVFLIDVFSGNEMLAQAVNHLLVVGFYLINFGFITRALRSTKVVDSAQGVIEALADRVGIVLLVLGVMHFFNLYVFSRIRRRNTLEQSLPPVGPDSCTPVMPGAVPAAAAAAA